MPNGPNIPQDYARPDRASLINGGDASLEAKRAAALAFLGERWVLHPANAPRRRRTPYGSPRRPA
jgi:hypothetical protein